MNCYIDCGRTIDLSDLSQGTLELTVVSSGVGGGLGVCIAIISVGPPVERSSSVH